MIQPPVAPETLTADDIRARLELVADLLSVSEAAEVVLVSTQTIRAAIRKGELEAFIPRGRQPKKAGPGMGYRIAKSDLQAWYFGT